ncbi:PAS domain-containing protein [Lichenicoccus sp.]|uniref:PAS domain-containing protein n=1 Tax=Lichenicoccus sp. TaxID=2781899 RepID=UPI003D13D342
MVQDNAITQALIEAMGHSPEAMVLTASDLPDHPMIAVNAAFSALTGYPPDEAVGRNCRFLQGSETDPEASRRIGRCLAQQRGCIEWIVNYRRDGTMFWNLLFLSPVFDETGKLLHVFGNQRDITAGQPEELPDYILGKADMPAQGRREFDAVLREVNTEAQSAGGVGQKASDRLLAAVHRLNELTIGLAAAPWSAQAH